MSLSSAKTKSASNPSPAIYSFERPRTKQAHVRGSLFSALPEFVKGHFGEPQWDEFLKRLEPTAQQALKTNLDALAWYPFNVITNAVDVMVQMSDQNRALDTLQKFATHNLDRATNLIFKAIFKIGSPEFMVSKSDQVWLKYYSTGRMEAECSKGRAIVRLLDFPEMTHNYNRVVMFAIAATITKEGGKITTQEIVRDIQTGSDWGEYRYEWRM
jgi:hypothetical protein